MANSVTVTTEKAVLNLLSPSFLPNKGYAGWSPILAVVADGARKVLQITDWTGGEGTKPATGYVGPSGIVSVIGSAVDLASGVSIADGSITNVMVSSSAAIEQSKILNLVANLAAKAAATDLTSHTNNVSNPHGVTKAQVGLSLVDNTPDTGKPVSTAQQTALDLKLNVSALPAVASQAEAEAGTENTKMMTALRVAQAIAEQAGTGDVSSVNGQTGAVDLDAGDIDEVTDRRYMTDAQESKLDGVAVGATANATNAQLRDTDTHTDGTNNKVYTAAEKTKLAGVEAGAQVNPSVASEAEAEAGSNNTKMMTPLRVAQAIAVLATGDSSGSVAASGDSIKKTVTQVSHGFTAEQPVYDNNGTWALARANAFSTSKVVGVVESVTDANTFVVVLGGAIALSGMTANKQYYLSDATAGLMVEEGSEPTAETSFVVPILKTSTASIGYVEIGDPLSLAKIPDAALENPVPDQVDSGEITAGTETALRSYSPADVKEFVETHAPAGDSTKKTVTQASHGFTVGQWLYDNNGTLTGGRANAYATSKAVGVVETVVNSNTFVMVLGGRIVLTGMTANKQYFGSDATVGLLVAEGSEPTAEGSFVVPILRTSTTSLGYVEIGEPLSLAKIPDSALVNPVPAQVDSGEITAGTETELRSYSPADVVSIVNEHSAGSTGIPTGMQMFFERAGIASLPSGFVECDGNNGTDDKDDVDGMAVVIKHGGTVATPELSSTLDTDGFTRNVTLACDTSGVVIKYTTNGATPSRSVGTTYSGPFGVGTSTTVKAIAYRTPSNPTLTMLDSAVLSQLVTVIPIITLAEINETGDELILTGSEALEIGGGGGTGIVLEMSGGAVTATYDRTNTLGQIIAALSRVILSDETPADGVTYTQPTNGIQAAASGDDVASFADMTVDNQSTATEDSSSSGGVEVPTPDVLHWPLDDSAGSTIVAAVGPGSSSNTGTLNGSFLSMAGGNGAFGSSTDVAYGTDKLTVSFWYRKSSYTPTGPVLRSGYINPTPRFTVSQDGAYFDVVIDNVSGSCWNRYITPFTLDVWHHVAVVFDNSVEGGSLKVHMDGTLLTPDSTSSDSTGTSNFATDLFHIKSIFSTGQVFDLDDLRIYAGELTEGQIDAIHAAGRS